MSKYHIYAKLNNNEPPFRYEAYNLEMAQSMVQTLLARGYAAKLEPLGQVVSLPQFIKDKQARTLL